MLTIQLGELGDKLTPVGELGDELTPGLASEKAKNPECYHIINFSLVSQRLRPNREVDSTKELLG
jgi:hypothetical protein